MSSPAWAVQGGDLVICAAAARPSLGFLVPLLCWPPLRPAVHLVYLSLLPAGLICAFSMMPQILAIRA